MNRTSLIIMGGALFIAVVVAMLVSMKLAPKTKVATAGAEVLVASHDMMTGEILKVDNVHWENFPDNAIYNGVIKRKDQTDDTKLDVYGKPLRRDVRSGEPVTMQALVDSRGGGNYLAATLHPGMRAVGIPVKPETTAGGFISPGDYVDVILNFQLNLKGDAANYSDDTAQRFASETILSNVRILAVDQNAKDDAHEAKVGRTVTLEVTKQGAQILAMSSTMGELSLALRRLGEKDTETDENSPLTTDVTTSKVIQRIYKAAARGKTPPTTVRVYSGDSVTNVPVRPTSQAEMGN